MQAREPGYTGVMQELQGYLSPVTYGRVQTVVESIEPSADFPPHAADALRNEVANTVLYLTTGYQDWRKMASHTLANKIRAHLKTLADINVSEESASGLSPRAELELEELAVLLSN